MLCSFSQQFILRLGELVSTRSLANLLRLFKLGEFSILLPADDKTNFQCRWEQLPQRRLRLLEGRKGESSLHIDCNFVGINATMPFQEGKAEARQTGSLCVSTAEISWGPISPALRHKSKLTEYRKRHYETLSNHVWKQEIIHWCKDVQGRGYAWPNENCCAEMSWDVGTGYAPIVEDCCAESCATCVLHSCYIWTTCIVLHFIFFSKEVKGHQRPHIFFLSCFPLS